ADNLWADGNQAPEPGPGGTVGPVKRLRVVAQVEPPKELSAPPRRAPECVRKGPQSSAGWATMTSMETSGAAGGIFCLGSCGLTAATLRTRWTRRNWPALRSPTAAV